MINEIKTENGLTITPSTELARDEDHDIGEHRPQPHKGPHKHVCPRCFKTWEHRPKVCWIKAMATCVYCLREMDEIRNSA